MASAVDDKEKPRKSKVDKLVVAAIDFGTTYSGYAFQMHHDFEKDRTKISTNTNWIAGTTDLMSLKTPSILLLKPDKTFEAFGFEAENRYMELAEDGLHKDYYYFRRFKMLLHKIDHLKRCTELTDDQGKKLPALDVFSASIEYLKKELMDTLHKRATGMTENDLHWVLTVPAIWSDGSKQFMRVAAEMAGIKPENLTIALEPEAASLFCMHLPVDRMKMDGNIQPNQISPFAKGTKYMVVDVGGGTVDITVHEVVDEDKLKELFWPSGGAWGGTQVDKAYESFLAKIFGEKVFERFSKEATEDLIDLHREFETKKRAIRTDITGRETIKLPVRLMDMYLEMTGKTVDSAVKDNSEFKGKLTYTAGKLRMNAEIMKSWFDESCNETVNHLKTLFEHTTVKDISIILLVGGFSESPMMQAAMQKNFPGKRLIVPEDEGLAVLKGAVLFGRNPITIISRVAKCSYGIRVFRDFQPGVHPEDKKVQVGKRLKCADVFAIHVKKGQELVVGEAQSKQRYIPLEADQMTLDFDVYTSLNENPLFVTDEGCTKIGQLVVDVPDLSKGKDRAVWVKMIFGGTELTVEATEEKTGNVSKAIFDFLQ